MKVLQYVERAWIIAAAVALVVSFVNLLMVKKIDTLVYFPFFCSVFCVLIWFNIRGQRKFREKIFNETEEGKPLK